MQSVTCDTRFPLRKWRHVVLTVDGEDIRVHDTGLMVASAPCGPMADCGLATLWFGTDAEGIKLWNGRIDELTLFDRPLGEAEIADLHRAALEEMEGAN